MKIKQYRDYFISTLTPIYDALEGESFFSLVLEDFRGMKRVDLAMNPEAKFSSEEISKWNEVVDKLKQEIPIQYILGKAHFFGLEFEVNQNVLIPRPETEELVSWILSDGQINTRAIANRRSKLTNLHILDIGTGSGCIAIALAGNIPNAEVYAIDVSTSALATAKKNASLNNVKVNFIEKDILKTEQLDLKFDIIVSNPPYVRNLEKNEIRKNVLDNEPHLALFVEDDDALLFYRKISELAVESLKEGGSLYFEINQYLRDKMIELLENKGFSEIEIRKDIYGNDRMIKATRNAVPQ